MENAGSGDGASRMTRSIGSVAPEPASANRSISPSQTRQQNAKPQANDPLS
jgi:hypothetical protein